MLIEKLRGITGKVTLSLFDNNNVLRLSRTIDNLVVNTGLYHIADQLSDQGENQMSHIAIGIDNTAPQDTDTTLANELARVAVDSITQGAGASANIVTYVATFDPGVGTGSIVEAGIFNAASSGVMLTRSVFAVISKGALDTLVATWELTVA